MTQQAVQPENKRIETISKLPSAIAAEVYDHRLVAFFNHRSRLQAAAGDSQRSFIKNQFIQGALIAGLALVMVDRVTAQTSTTLHSFIGPNDGASPSAGLILSGDTLYGTAQFGGSSGVGTVFAINTDGTGLRTLHSFSASFPNNSDGALPVAGLILAGNTLYGTAAYGGSSENGTVFAINNDGTGFRTLHNFNYDTDGGEPSGGLVLSGNTLYGTAQFGGSLGNGTVFAINTDGTDFKVLHRFNYNTDGGEPIGSLTLSGNTLYGTTQFGGTFDSGTVFAINTDGTGFRSLHSFDYDTDGDESAGGLVLSGNTLYGTAQFGGSSGNGTVFAINTDGSDFKVLHNFTGGFINSDGASPYAGLILSGNTLYGTAQYGGSSTLGTIFAVNTDGTGFTNLHSFTGAGDGLYPQAGLVSSVHRLYGTATYGGRSGNGTVSALCKMNPTIPIPPGFDSAPGQPVTGNGWSMEVQVSQDDGIVLTNVMLGVRYMAKKISLPYYSLVTSTFRNPHCELKPNSSDPSARSRLVDFKVTHPQPGTDEPLGIEGTYEVHFIGQSCLVMTQRYEFYPLIPGEKLEPSGLLKAQKFKPILAYQFLPTEDESLVSLTCPQRLHLQNEGAPRNFGGLFLDTLDPLNPVVTADNTTNPLNREFLGNAINHGTASGSDNFHLTYLPNVDVPNPTELNVSGCEECIHIHWRWGPLANLIPPFDFTDGNPLIPPGSDQDVDVAVARLKAGEDDPNNFLDTLVPLESLVGEQLVFWYVGTGRRSADSFFTHGGFFAPVSSYAFTPLGNGVTVWPGGIQITFGQVIVDGVTIAVPVDPTTVGQLPGGFAIFPNLGYDIASSATVIGPITLGFIVPVDDPDMFAALRVLHFEDGVLVDRTTSSDFPTRTVYASVNSLSPFVIASLVTQAPIISCPPNITTGTDPGVCSAVVSFSPSATGNEVTIGCIPPSGSAFAVGTTTVTCTATDITGQSATCSFTLTVSDKEPPAVSCQAASTAAVGVDCQARVPDLIPNVTSSDNCTASDALTVTQDPVAGTSVGLGTTTITVTATDSAGNSGSCTTTVTVVDSTAPSINCPADIVSANDPGQSSAVVNYAVSASDNCSTVPVVCNPPSGSTFPVGTTPVICTATDAAGNAASCTFSVTVEAGTGTKCPQDQGFWKTNLASWPLASLTLGNQEYSRSKLETILRLPVKGDASVLLARQLIVAKLNIASGSGPTPISSTIEHADSLLSGFNGKLPYGVQPSSPTGKLLIKDADKLGDFNSGLLTPGCVP